MRRPLDDREHELLRHMIAFAAPGDRDALWEQADAVVVTGRCDCGCPTIDLEVDAGRASPIAGERVIVEASWAPPEGHGGGVLLFATDGWLSLLEVWSVDEPPPTHAPPPAEVVRP